MVRFSYGLAPVHRAGKAVELVKTAEELGFHGCYLGDDLSMQDPWVLCGGRDGDRAVAEDSAVAKQAARTIVAGWLPTLPRKLMARHGLDESVIDPIARAMTEGDLEGALDRTPTELVEALALAGTPEECVEKIRRDLIEPGIDHVIMGVVDPDLVEGVSGARLDGLPDTAGQLRIIHDRIFPAFHDR